MCQFNSIMVYYAISKYMHRNWHFTWKAAGAGLFMFTCWHDKVITRIFEYLHVKTIFKSTFKITLHIKNDKRNLYTLVYNEYIVF